MAASMPPPMVPGFSLRVQLYSPTARAPNDKPTRCFRVVTKPEATVQEFCAEVSRIHEINYGEPIAIKKCQDDQEFDITQSEVIGAIFTNAATIRVIQATQMPGVRDSVPPTSALRFDPKNYLGRKREREGSHRPSGPASPSSWQPKKRQRVADIDPDQALPSREENWDVRRTICEVEEPDEEIIVDSQLDTSYAEINGNSRHVRSAVARVSETPSPPLGAPLFAPPQSLSTDRHVLKLNDLTNDNPLMSDASIQSPFGPASMRAQAARSKSASYHIQRATERGTSVSTAATSPLFGDQQNPTMNGIGSSNKRKVTEPGLELMKINEKPNPRSENEDSIYDTIPSDNEGSVILRRTKDKLKGKSNSPSGLPGLDWAKTFSTPPIGTRRTSRSNEPTAANGALPLTPNSKSREERQYQNDKAEEARKAKAAAVVAAEQRKRDADEARAAEDQERVKKLREKSDRDAQEKRNAVIATAARLEQERLQQIKEMEERRAEDCRLEQERILEKISGVERLEKQKAAPIVRDPNGAETSKRGKPAAVAKERQDREKSERTKAATQEAKHLSENEAKILPSTEEERKLRERSESSKASVSERPKAAPIRPQSSTPFIPSGRKSALKTTSSQATASPSPELGRTVSISSSNGSRNELDVPTGAKRRVSFDVDQTPKARVTPIRPPILPPVRSTSSKPVSAIKAPKAVAVEEEVSTKPTPRILIATAKQSITPILPPTSRDRRKEQSMTPVVPPRPSTATKAIAAQPLPATKSISPAARSVSQSIEVRVGSSEPKNPSKFVSPLPVQVTIPSDSESDEEAEDSEEDENEEEDDDNDSEDDSQDLDGPSRINPIEALNSSLRSPAKARPERKLLSPSPDQEDDKDGDVEMRDVQSNRSSSRSPVVFQSHATLAKVEPTKSTDLVSSSDDLSNEDEFDNDEESTSEAQDDEDKTITTAAPQSSLLPPPRTPAAKISPEWKLSQRKNTTVSSGTSGKDSPDMQDEVDFQLTLSMFEASSAATKSTPIPAPSSSNTARPKSSFGVTLSSLAKTAISGASMFKPNGKAQPMKLAEKDEESESESEEESDSESSSDSDGEQEPSQSLPKPKQIRPSANDFDDLDLESDSESGSDKENEDDMEAHRSDLAKQIVEMTNGSRGSSQNFEAPSAKKAQGPSGSVSNTRGGKKVSGGSMNDKYLTKYQFSQPR